MENIRFHITVKAIVVYHHKILILKRIRPAITYMKVGRGEKYKLKSHLPFNLNQL